MLLEEFVEAKEDNMDQNKEDGVKVSEKDEQEEEGDID